MIFVLVTELNGERDHLSEKYENARVELLHLQGRVSTLAEDLNRMKTEDNNKIPIAVHTSAVNECRRFVLCFNSVVNYIMLYYISIIIVGKLFLQNM